MVKQLKQMKQEFNNFVSNTTAVSSTEVCDICLHTVMNLFSLVEFATFQPLTLSGVSIFS